MGLFHGVFPRAWNVNRNKNNVKWIGMGKDFSAEQLQCQENVANLLRRKILKDDKRTRPFSLVTRQGVSCPCDQRTLKIVIVIWG